VNLETYELKAQVVKALAHPLRLAICEYLLETKEPKCVNYIASVFNKNQSVISKHLSILQQASIVKIQKEGVFTRYTLTQPEIIDNLLKSINEIVKKTAENNIRLTKHL